MTIQLFDRGPTVVGLFLAFCAGLVVAACLLTIAWSAFTGVKDLQSEPLRPQRPPTVIGFDMLPNRRELTVVTPEDEGSRA